MLQELKMKSLKGHAASIIIALALAAGLLWGTGFGAFKAIGGPKPLDSLDVSELKGQYVEAEVYLIYDWYAYTERTNTSTNRSTVTEKEYIIPVGDAEYMGLAVDAGYISTADDLLDASYELLTGASQTPGESFTVRGTILPMSGESLDFYHQVVGRLDGRGAADVPAVGAESGLPGQHGTIRYLAAHGRRGRGAVCGGLDAGGCADGAVPKTHPGLLQGKRESGSDAGTAGNVLPEH